jgi:hypothetical protein
MVGNGTRMTRIGRIYADKLFPEGKSAAIRPIRVIRVPS